MNSNQNQIIFHHSSVAFIVLSVAFVWRIHSRLNWDLHKIKLHACRILDAPGIYIWLLPIYIYISANWKGPRIGAKALSSLIVIRVSKRHKSFAVHRILSVYVALMSYDKTDIAYQCQIIAKLRADMEEGPADEIFSSRRPEYGIVPRLCSMHRPWRCIKE